MNFFEAQDQARRGTRKMVVLFVLAVIATVLALNAVALGVKYAIAQNQEYPSAPSNTATSVGGFDLWQPELFATVSIATLGLIFLASSYKTLQISGDGGKVARLMGGRRLDPQSPDADERKLLNVVEEMSIASGVPVPDVYLIDDEPGINAFAAGSTINDAAVGVTRGCVEKLNRDELQGVIAHEFSHILNGDMRLNMRLIGVVFGILVIGLLGYTLFRWAPYMLQGSRSSSSKEKGGGAGIGLVLLLVGAAVWLIGSIGVLFGRMIQASVSRQREFLADASAVQFTRNPTGIRDALRKIGGNSARAVVRNRHAGEISHMWFGEALPALFATHPPLPDRIRAVDPNWDGKMLKAEFVDPREDAAHLAEQRRSRAPSAFNPDELFEALGLGRPARGGRTGAVAGVAAGLADESAPAPGRAQRMRLRADAVSDRVGQVTQDHVRFAALLMKALPPQIVEAAHDPEQARGLVIAMLLSPNRGVRLMQDEAAAQKDPAAASAAAEYAPILRQFGPGVRMAVLDLCIPALRQIDASTRSHFISVLDDLVKADERVEPFEFALYTLVEQQLLPRRGERVRFTTLGSVGGQAQTLLSALAAAGNHDAKTAERAYRLGIGKLQQGQLKYEPRFTIEQLNESMRDLADAAPPLKQQLIDAAAAVVAADGQVSVDEAELLRAFAAVMNCPLPPFIQAAPQMAKASNTVA